MRLPQSSSRPLCFCAVSITLIFALAVAPPLHARQVTNQLVASPSNLRFGLVALGQSESQEVVLANTGETGATISSISVSGSEFSISGTDLPATLGAGQSVALNIIFTPTGVGWTSGKITVTSNAENPTLEIGTEGTGTKTVALTPAPSSLSFGQVSVGSTTTSSVVVTNTYTSKITINSFSTVGSGFSVSGPSTPMTLGAGQSVTLSVSFTPQAAGMVSGSIFIYGPALSIPLTGTGTMIGQLNISPATLSFGNVDVGSSTTQPSSMTATGGSVTVSSANSSNSQFSIAGISLPVTINAGQSVAFDVVFAPTKTGADSGTLSFSSNASGQGGESLSGTGISPTYSVNLSWNGSTSQVSGYNVYRGSAPGAYSKINSALDPNTAYTDSTVVSGATYYYAATSVNSSGQESTYSAPIEVAVP
jgi:Abnormal spindle-like microcephaly-assoc'd, ASPM-SPD-2-Hydin